MRVVPASYADLAWLRRMTTAALTDTAQGVAAKDRDGRTRGVVVFDLWTPASAHCHVALSTPIAARSLLKPAFHYLFEYGERRMALGVVRAKNTKSLSLALALGFSEWTRVVDGWELGEDLVLLYMRREECRWLADRRL